jgi:hypothetical protein
MRASLHRAYTNHYIVRPSHGQSTDTERYDTPTTFFDIGGDIKLLTSTNMEIFQLEFNLPSTIGSRPVNKPRQEECII